MSKDRTKKGSWLVIILLIIGALLGNVIGGEAGKEIANQEKTDNSNYQIISETGFTTLHFESHMKGCLEAGSNENYCKCTFDYMKNKVTPDQLKTYMEQTKRTGEIPQFILDGVESCKGLK